MKVLFIDTTLAGQAEVKLKLDKRELVLRSQQKFGSQALLGLIVEILKKATLKMSDLTAIEVNPGPGSYTGIKVGVAVANSLGYALSLPVNGKKQANGLY